MPRRRLATLAAAALAAAVAGCDNKCPTESPKIASGGVPSCSGIQAGAQVSVAVRVCPTCNQTLDTCNVVQADNIIQLDPLVQACDPANSCPPSCSIQPVSCTFRAPTAPGSYQLLVYDPATGPVQTPFVVVASGGSTTCGT